MALKNLLVIVDGSRHNEARLKLAFALAVSHDAFVTGLLVLPEFQFPAFLGAEVPPDLIATHQRAVEDMVERLRGEFVAAAEAAGRSMAVAFETDTAPAIEAATRAACYADLTVIGQPDPDESLGTPVLSPDDLVMTAGGPLLVVPYIDPPAEIGRRILVAWNGAREAARAIADARPLLARAEAVTVLTIDGSTTGKARAHSMAERLGRLGVPVEARPLDPGGASPGDIILNTVSDLGIDLVVMGAYGHARWQELILGGATRSIMQHMTAPVLMSH